MHNNSGQNDKTKRPNYTNDSVRINLTISKTLLDRIDKAAKQDYTSRSDIIRQSVLFYLRPLGRDLEQTDPETIIKVLHQRKMIASINKILKQDDT